jgi:hypothetical protein
LDCHPASCTHLDPLGLPSSIMHSPRPSWTAIQHHALTSTLLDCHPASCTHLDPLGLPSSIMHSPRPSWTFSTRYTNAAAGATMAFAAEAADVLGLIPASLEEWRSKSGSMLIPTAVFCLTWPNASVKGETNESEQPRPHPDHLHDLFCPTLDQLHGHHVTSTYTCLPVCASA